MEFSYPDINIIAPEIIIACTAMFVLILEVIKSEKIFSAFASLLGVAAAFYLSVSYQGTVPATSFSGMFIIDGYSNFFKYIFYLNLVLTIFISIHYKGLDRVPHGEYYSLLLFSTCGMMLMASSLDLILLFVGLELVAIPVYVLVGIKRSDPRSNESALKYILLGTFVSAILLFGITLIYGITATTNINEIAQFITKTQLQNNSIIIMGLIFFIVAFSFKLAFVPFHMWAPDVYEGAPTTVTAFLTSGPKAAGFVIMGRVLVETLSKDSLGSGEFQTHWFSILWVLSVMTIIVGNLMALTQVKIKRLFAYSSIAHAGYLLTGIITATPEGLRAVMNYLMIYTIMNTGAFSVVIMLNKEGAVGEHIDDYKGLAKKHPVSAFVMLLFMFSLTGIPPTAGFIAKFYLFMEVIKSGYFFLVIISVLMSVVSAYYYLRIVMYMYMKEPEKEIIPAFSFFLTLVLLFTSFGVIFIGIFPSGLLELVKASVHFP
jgi:NADH-quinone oxidoreductase subunit N